jgi:hypothetical protein
MPCTAFLENLQSFASANRLYRACFQPVSLLYRHVLTERREVLHKNAKKCAKPDRFDAFLICFVRLEDLSAWVQPKA